MSPLTAYIVDGVRTAGGKKNGQLSEWQPADLGAAVIDALVTVRCPPRTGILKKNFNADHVRARALECSATRSKAPTWTTWCAAA